MTNLTYAANTLSKARILIDDTPALSVREVRARCRRFAADKDLMGERGYGLIIIDYLQLMRGTVAGKNVNREQEISEISRGLKALAKELSCPVVALSQLNRSLESRENKRPQLADLRECVTGDTLVVLADGRRVAIASLVGQTPEVVAMAPDGELLTAHSDKVWPVGRRPIFDLRLASGRSLRATGRHRLYTATGWTRVDDLAPGVLLRADRPTWDVIAKLEPAGEEEVYDLTVPGPASWLADGIVSHNSGAIEQDADLILFIYRDVVYNENTENPNVAEIILGKNRHGPITTVKTVFEGRYTRFENLSQREQ
jgi:replicative DNA helicase